MLTGAIIQARQTSTRLPNKVLERVGGQILLDRIINQLYRCWSLDLIVLAIPDTHDNRRLVGFARDRVGDKLKLFIGPEEDVLKRFIEAAKEYKIDNIVRVCGDSPFILSWLIDVGVSSFLKSKCDYLFTTNFPPGQNIEVVKSKVLEKIYPKCNAVEREHVTLYLEHHPIEYKNEEVELNLTVDTEDGLEIARKLSNFYDR